MGQSRPRLPFDAPTIGSVRRARGIDGEKVRAGALERVVQALLEELQRRTTLERLAAAHEGARRGRPLPALADELRRLADDLVA